MCDTMVVVGEDGVLFAKNSDRDPNEAQLLDWQQRRSHPPGARLRCTWIEIDQAPLTHSVLLSRPFWMWGAEIGANEHGVTVGNEAVFTTGRRQRVGLTGMDLVRLGVERAATARQAVDVITGLLEHHGQGGGCGHEDRNFSYDNSYIVADRHEAFVLETAGREWAIEHVARGARTISNELTISDFATGRSQRVRTHFSRCRTRRAATEAAAGLATNVDDLMAALREHGTDDPSPHYSPITGAMAAPCMHAGGLVAASQTTASWVAELTPTGDRHWCTATAAPCTGLFKPVAVAEPVDLGPPPTDRFDPRTAWWRHELLHRRCLTDPERLMPRFAAERDEVERRWREDPPPSSEAFGEADGLLARWTQAVWRDDVSDARPRWARRYWRVRNERAGLPARPVSEVQEERAS